LDVVAPTAADAFDVKTFSEYADFAPGIPVLWDEYFVSVDDVVL